VLTKLIHYINFFDSMKKSTRKIIKKICLFSGYAIVAVLLLILFVHGLVYVWLLAPGLVILMVILLISAILINIGENL